MIRASFVEPSEGDYPTEMFRGDLPPELRVGCGWAYFGSLPFVKRIFRNRLRITFQLAPQGALGQVLDAGTGVGFLLPGLAAVAEKVVGADLSRVVTYARTMVNRRGLRNVALVNADILALPFVEGSFDLVTCLSVIEHVPDPAAALSELARVLRERGTAIVGYPVEHTFFRLLESLLFVHYRLQKGKPKGEPFRPHVNDIHEIERSWNGLFKVDKLRSLRLFGLPSYRVVRLTKLAGETNAKS
jgi:SAM-dependent methyltransferase